MQHPGSADFDLASDSTLSGSSSSLSVVSVGAISGDGVTTTGGDASFTTRNDAGRNISITNASFAGDIFAEALDSAGSSSANGDIFVSESGTADVATVTTAGSVELISTDAIVDANGGTVNVTGSSVTLRADQGIGVGNAIELTATHDRRRYGEWRRRPGQHRTS